MIIPFTYNVLKRHPALMTMIHRTDAIDNNDQGSFYLYLLIILYSSEQSLVAFVDPFDPTESNPTLTNALNSSLWEIISHRRHYHSTVSTMTRIFEEAFTKPNYAMEDFLDHTYATVSPFGHHQTWN